MKIVVTGGAGYIGLHIIEKLLTLNYEILVCDTYENLKWNSKYSHEDMCLDTWNWQSKNPTGY